MQPNSAENNPSPASNTVQRILLLEAVTAGLAEVSPPFSEPASLQLGDPDMLRQGSEMAGAFIQSVSQNSRRDSDPKSYRLRDLMFPDKSEQRVELKVLVFEDSNSQPVDSAKEAIQNSIKKIQSEKITTLPQTQLGQCQLAKKPKEFAETPSPIAQFPEPLNSESDFQFLTIDGITNFHETWQKEAHIADTIVFVAPEPHLLRWQSFLQPWQEKLWLPSIEWTRFFQRKSISSEIPSCFLDSPELLEDSATWVIKPEDSCGSQGIFKFTYPNSVSCRQAKTEFLSWAENQSRETKNLIMMPWLDGRHLSVSLCFGKNRSWILPPCRQHLQFQPCDPWNQNFSVNQIHFLETERLENPKNLRKVHKKITGYLEEVARKHSLSLDAIYGWIGFDLIETKEGEFTIVEINGRMTTSIATYSRLVFEY